MKENSKVFDNRTGLRVRMFLIGVLRWSTLVYVPEATYAAAVVVVVDFGNFGKCCLQVSRVPKVDQFQVVLLEIIQNLNCS